MRQQQDADSMPSSHHKDQDQIKDVCDTYSLEYCPSEASAVKEVGVKYHQSPESFRQKDKDIKSDLCSAARLSRRIGRRHSIMMKPLNLNPILRRLCIESKKLNKAKRATRKELFWLKVQRKSLEVVAKKNLERATTAEGRHHAWRRTIGKQTEELKQLRGEISERCSRAEYDELLQLATEVEQQMVSHKDQLEYQLQQNVRHLQKIAKLEEEAKKFNTTLSFGPVHKLIKDGGHIPDGNPTSVSVVLAANQEYQVERLRARNATLEMENGYLKREQALHDDDLGPSVEVVKQLEEKGVLIEVQAVLIKHLKTQLSVQTKEPSNEG